MTPWRPLLVPALVGVTIAAMQLLPSFELFLLSSRKAQGIPWATVEESFLHWQDLLTVVYARALGDEHAFHGPGRLLMPRLYVGLAGLWFLWRGWRAGGFARRLALWLVPVTVGIALAAPVYAALLQFLETGPRLRYIGHAVLAGWPAVCLLAGSGAAAMRRRHAIPLAALLVVDLLWSFHGYEVKAPMADLLAPAHVTAKKLGDGRLFSPIWLQQVFDDSAQVPVTTRYTVRAALLPPNLAQLDGIVNVAGYEPFDLAAHADLFRGWETRDRASLAAALKATGARWMIGPLTEALPGWRLRERPVPGWGLWESPGSPRVSYQSPCQGWHGNVYAPLSFACGLWISFVALGILLSATALRL